MLLESFGFNRLSRSGVCVISLSFLIRKIRYVIRKEVPMKTLFVLFVAFAGIHASAASFEINGKKVSIEVPKSWEAVKDLFGIPLAILGPWANESRPVLSILPTGVTTDKMPEEKFKKLFEDFKKDKDQWVQSHKGELLSYEPTTEVVLSTDLKGHYIGAEFKINAVHFIERSYYLYCKKDLYNLKYSIRDEHRKYLKDLQKMVQEFKCE